MQKLRRTLRDEINSNSTFRTCYDVELKYNEANGHYLCDAFFDVHNQSEAWQKETVAVLQSAAKRCGLLLIQIKIHSDRM